MIAIQSNAVVSLYGIAILSASYELIVAALDTIRQFTNNSTQSNSDKVFEKSQEALSHFLSHISDTFNKTRSLHYYSSEFECAVFGTEVKQMKNGNPQPAASITTDGMYIYIIEYADRHEQLYKIGNGMLGTTAGKIYNLQVYVNEEKGPQTVYPSWVYCKGFLYLRYGSFGNIHVLDATDFKELSVLKLDMSSIIAEANQG